jgi:hypothetical protein
MTTKAGDDKTSDGLVALINELLTTFDVRRVKLSYASQGGTPG